MLIKTRYIITMTGDVIENGAVRTEGERIAEVGRDVKATKADATIRLDDCILLPGLVNAHCHLDCSYLADRFPPRRSFAAWVADVVAARANVDIGAIMNGLRTALQQCYGSGVTCVGDHVGHWQALPFLLQMPLKGRAFLEIVGPTEERARAAMTNAATIIDRQTAAAKRMALSITPHAAYSVHPTVLRELLSTSAHDAPISIHCAESEEEWICLSHCSGPLYDFAQGRGLSLSVPARSPVEYLTRHGGLPNHCVVVHGNYLDDADLASLMAAHTTIVHCPASHQFFGHAPFPLDRVRAAGIPVALGTDSLASASTLSMLTAMQMMKERYPGLAAKEILTMATIHGARALRLDDRCGAIAPGLAADLIAVPMANATCDPYENVLCNTEVPFVVIDGRIVRNVTKGCHATHGHDR